MAVPQKRQSNTRRNKRRANHDRTTPPTLGPCPKCGEPRRPHRVCPSCGSYGSDARGFVQVREAVEDE